MQFLSKLEGQTYGRCPAKRRDPSPDLIEEETFRFLIVIYLCCVVVVSLSLGKLKLGRGFSTPKWVYKTMAIHSSTSEHQNLTLQVEGELCKVERRGLVSC